MKKTLFKPNSKIGENFDFSKLHEMLLQKINYFYKTYIRHIKKIQNVLDNTKVFEYIRQDVEEFIKNEKEKYSFSSKNLSDKNYSDLDLKNLMIINFFRCLGGRNPFLKSNMAGETMDLFLNQEEKEEEH